MAKCKRNPLDPSYNSNNTAIMPTLLLLIIIIYVHHEHDIGCEAKKEPLIEAMFVFGDSLVDAGNNNYLPTLARCDYYPYGMDFPLGATGRFCNGRTVPDALDVIITHGMDFPLGATGRFCNGRTMPDALGEILGLNYAPVYLNPATKGPSILHGVNYASGAGGILDASGANYIARLSFNKQLKNFEKTLLDLNSQLGGEGPTAAYLSKALFSIVFGSNDYINNYFLPRTNTSKQYTPDAYRTLLIKDFSQQLKTLYNLGARRFLITGVGPLGCIPNQRAGNSKEGGCVEKLNYDVVRLNAAMKKMVQDFNNDTSLSGATFLFANVYDTVADMISNPAKYGFKVVDTACCGIGKFKGQLSCLYPLARPCRNRNAYVFWDAFHPTDAVNVVLAKKLFDGSPSEIFPVNVRQLILQKGF